MFDKAEHESCKLALDALKEQNGMLMGLVENMREQLRESNATLMKMHGIGHERMLLEMREQNAADIEKADIVREARAVDRERHVEVAPHELPPADPEADRQF